MVGNTPNFSKIDTLRCFLRLEKKKGRQKLANELQLGEGTVRTILEILKSKKLLESGKKCHNLSSQGAAALDRINKYIKSMPRNQIMRWISADWKLTLALRKEIL